MGGHTVKTSLEIAVSGLLEGLAAGNAAKELASEVETEVGQLAQSVGLADALEVRVSVSDTPRPLRVLVNGVSAPYPPDLLWQLSMEHREVEPEEEEAGTSIADDCLAEHCRGGECAPKHIARLVVSMIRDRPALLVDDAQAESFAAKGGGKAVSPADLRHVLASLLDLGVLPRRETVIDALAANRDRVEDAVEAAFATLQGRRVEICVSMPYRTMLTGAESSEPTLVSAESAMAPIAKEFFELVEERLLVEWGLVPPDIVWTTAPGMRDGTIVVRVNDRLSAPYQGLDEGEGLLFGESIDSATAEGQTKRKLRNPGNAGFRLAVVDLPVAERSEGSVGAGAPAAFAALVVYREIITNAHRLISTEQTLYLLQDLERRAPELVHLVLRHFTVAQVTQVLRALVRERIPPRLLPMMLERLARLTDSELSAEARPEFVRRGLSEYLLHRFARGELARTFFELSPEIDQGLSTTAWDDLYAERLRDAVWATLRKTDVPPVLAALLVRKAPRDVVFNLLAPELPELVVIRRSELGAEVLEPPTEISLAEERREALAGTLS